MVHVPVGTLGLLALWDLVQPVVGNTRKLRALLYGWSVLWLLGAVLTGYRDLSLTSTPPPPSGVHQGVALLLGGLTLWLIPRTVRDTLSPSARRMVAVLLLGLVVLQGYTGGLMGHGG